jgi:hypothetical protein
VQRLDALDRLDEPAIGVVDVAARRVEREQRVLGQLRDLLRMAVGEQSVEHVQRLVDPCEECPRLAIADVSAYGGRAVDQGAVGAHVERAAGSPYRHRLQTLRQSLVLARVLEQKLDQPLDTEGAQVLLDHGRVRASRRTALEPAQRHGDAVLAERALLANRARACERDAPLAHTEVHAIRPRAVHRRRDPLVRDLEPSHRTLLRIRTSPRERARTGEPCDAIQIEHVMERHAPSVARTYVGPALLNAFEDYPTSQVGSSPSLRLRVPRKVRPPHR